MPAENIPQQLTDIQAALTKLAPTNEQASLDALAASVKALSDAQAQQAAQLAAIAAVLGIDGGSAPVSNNPAPTPPQPMASLSIDGAVTSSPPIVATPL